MKQKQNIFKNFGIKTIIDFRLPEEVEKHPDPIFEGINYYNIPSKSSTSNPIKTFDDLRSEIENIRESYTYIPFNNFAFKKLFEEILLGNTPIYFHCTSGKDRTGIAAALILTLFGVQKEDIFYDYLISNQHLAIKIENILARNEKRYSNEESSHLLREMNGVVRENLERSFNSILQKYETFDKYFEIEFGITSEMKKKLFDKYLE